MTRNESRFETKLIHFIIAILILKLLYVIFSTFMYGSFSDFLVAFIILVVLFFMLLGFIASMFNSGSDTFGNGTSTIGDRQFESLMNRYEKLCADFIEKKQYKKAAYIQLKLLKNQYAAAAILKEGHLYNEAANVYLKRCKDKYQAAECYKMARSYAKSIKLYKELNLHEEVGDIYTKMNDTKNAHHQYQIVVDNYTENDQYVKAALIYRKKMHNVDAANKLLLTGWKENKDAVNCANNFFASIKDTSKLKQVLTGFYKTQVNTGNEHHFTKVLKLEYNKENAPKKEIQDMAYALISRNSQNKEMLSHLNHFINDDSQLTKDITRHRMK